MENINMCYYPYAVRKWSLDCHGIKVIAEEHYFDDRDKAEQELIRCRKAIRKRKDKRQRHYRCSLEIYEVPIILSVKESE